MTRDDVLQKLAAARGDLDRFAVERLYVFGSIARDEATDDSDECMTTGIPSKRVSAFTSRVST